MSVLQSIGLRLIPLIRNDAFYLKAYWRYKMGYPLDLDHPQSFNEKIQWLKLYDRRPEYTKMVDKIEAKKYVASMIGEEHIIPTLAVYDSVEEIDYDRLPDKFVLKCSHDSGSIAICKDKASFDKAEAEQILKRGLKINYYWRTREWPYKDVKPRILAEKYVTEDGVRITDYKFFCFNGVPKFLYISKGLGMISFVTLDWQFMPFHRSDFPPFKVLPDKPSMFDEMIALAGQLSKGYPFVRVDLYQVGHTVLFSELTLHPGGGMLPFEPKEWDYKVGQWLDISQK